MLLSVCTTSSSPPSVGCRQVEDLQFQVVEGNVTGDEVQVASDVDRACLDEIQSENSRLKQRLQELEVCGMWGEVRMCEIGSQVIGEEGVVCAVVSE